MSGVEPVDVEVHPSFSGFMTFVAGGLNGLASVMMTLAIAYWIVIFTEFWVGDALLKVVVRAVNCVKRWLAVLSLVFFSLGVGIKGWNNSKALGDSIQHSSLASVDPMLLSINITVLVVCLAMCTVVFRKHYSGESTTVASSVAVIPPPLPVAEVPVHYCRVEMPPPPSPKTSDLEIKALMEQLFARVARLERVGRERRPSDNDRTVVEVVAPAGAGEPRVPNNACRSCGRTGHWRKDCNFRDFRCERCNQIGHTTNACRNYTLKDNQGRIKQLVEIKPTKIRTEAPLDSSVQDKVLTAQDVLQSVLEKAMVRTAKNKERRAAKNLGREPRRQVIEHPVAALPVNDFSDNESEDEEREEIVGVLKSLVKTERDPKTKEL